MFKNELKSSKGFFILFESSYRLLLVFPPSHFPQKVRVLLLGLLAMGGRTISQNYSLGSRQSSQN